MDTRTLDAASTVDWAGRSGAAEDAGGTGGPVRHEPSSTEATDGEVAADAGDEGALGAEALLV